MPVDRHCEQYEEMKTTHHVKLKPLTSVTQGDRVKNISFGNETTLFERRAWRSRSCHRFFVLSEFRNSSTGFSNSGF